MTGKFRGGYNPFSKNCCYNCCNTLCGPHYPSLKHPSKYVGKKPRKYTIPAKPYPPSSGNLSALSAAANNSIATSAGNNDPQVCLHHHRLQQQRLLHEQQQQGRGSICFPVLYSFPISLRHIDGNSPCLAIDRRQIKLYLSTQVTHFLE